MGGGGGSGGAGGGGGAGGSGGSGGSGGAGGGGDMGTTMGSGCAVGAPVLLVAVQSVDGSQPSDGRVLQLALTASGVTACGPQLTAANTLNKSPNSIGWIPPGYVAYAASDSVVLLDSAKDQLKWTYRPTQYGDVPLNVFPLAHNGAIDVGIGYDASGYMAVTRLALVDGKTGMQINWIDITSSTSPINLGSSVAGMVTDPRDPTQIIYSTADGSTSKPLSEVPVPWDGKTVVPTVYYPTLPPGSSIKALNTVKVGSVARAAWLQGSSSSTSDDIIYETEDDGSGPMLVGPLKCVNPMCAAPFKASDSAPDPSTPHKVISVCDAAANGSPLSNTRHVVRIDDSGNCEILVDGTKLPKLTYPVALGVAAAQ